MPNYYVQRHPYQSHPIIIFLNPIMLSILLDVVSTYPTRTEKAETRGQITPHILKEQAPLFGRGVHSCQGCRWRRMRATCMARTRVYTGMYTDAGTRKGVSIDVGVAGMRLSSNGVSETTLRLGWLRIKLDLYPRAVRKPNFDLCRTGIARVD